MAFSDYSNLCVLVLPIALVGCGSSTELRVPVHGKVTCNGQAADGGNIRFEPIGEERGPPRAATMVSIVNGEYKAETAGGLREGRYRVEVELWRKTGKKIRKRVFDEIAEVDETALVSSDQFAGKSSPLEYIAQSASDVRFDIDVPKR